MMIYAYASKGVATQGNPIPRWRDDGTFVSGFFNHSYDFGIQIPRRVAE